MHAKTVQHLNRFVKAANRLDAVIPDAIRAYRRSMGYTQKQMGIQLGCHSVQVCQIENGHIRPPDRIVRQFRLLVQESMMV